MNERVKIVEDALNVKLPLEYKDFIINVGIISDERGEVFGYIENIDIEKIPSVIGATKLYKEDYKNITDKEIVISFDDLKAQPIVLDTENGNIYNFDFKEKNKIDTNFNTWLNKILEISN